MRPPVPSISVKSSEASDAILDRFESDWRVDDLYLLDFVRTHGIRQQAVLLAEIICIDIDRRDSVGAHVPVSTYFQYFPELKSNDDVLGLIAFEEFRSKCSRGLHFDEQFWIRFPAVTKQDWFREHLASRSRGCQDRSNALESKQCRVGESTKPLVGERFGGFDIVCSLGKGAFSEVFLARQVDLADRYVAIKVVRRALGEPIHLARMQHPGIVPIYSFHQVSGYSVLCMPYAGATTLADWLSSVRNRRGESKPSGQMLLETVRKKNSRISTFIEEGSPSAARVAQPPLCESTWETEASGSGELNEANDSSAKDEASSMARTLAQVSERELPLWLAQRIGMALSHAHARGIIHGDLKPANILIRNDGDPALIDFNLSRDSSCPDDQITGGTLPYMAPEQIASLMSRQISISPASDIYSLGVILYELAFGVLPFPSVGSFAEVDLQRELSILRNRKPLFKSGMISKGLESIIRKCLEWDPKLRYQDAQQFLEDVEAECEFRPLHHAHESRRTGLAKVMRRHHRSIVAIAALTAFMITTSTLALSVNYWRSDSQVMKDRQQQREFRSFLGSQALRLLESDQIADSLLLNTVVEKTDWFLASRRESALGPSHLSLTNMELENWANVLWHANYICYSLLQERMLMSGVAPEIESALARHQNLCEQIEPGIAQRRWPVCRRTCRRRE